VLEGGAAFGCFSTDFGGDLLLRSGDAAVGAGGAIEVITRRSYCAAVLLSTCSPPCCTNLVGPELLIPGRTLTAMLQQRQAKQHCRRFLAANEQVRASRSAL
jgi:hypothetical protein